MKNTKISMVSKGFKILALTLTIFFISLTISLCFYIEQVNWYALMFSCLLTFGAIAIFVICYLNSLSIDEKNKELIIFTYKRRKIKLDEINKIFVETTNSIDKSKYCFITIKLNNGTKIKISGFSTLRKSKAVELTHLKVSQLNAEILKFTDLKG